jgi:hypothetical protein
MMGATQFIDFFGKISTLHCHTRKRTHEQKIENPMLELPENIFCKLGYHARGVDCPVSVLQHAGKG